MISVEEALAKVLDNVTVLDTVQTPILEALGQVLAEDITAEFNIPPRDNSAMDGYAVRAADTAGATAASPEVLRVVGAVAAGEVSETSVGPGSAIRIMTGAPLPAGADAVVQFENTDEPERPEAATEIGIQKAAAPGLNVRRAGEDVTAGSVVLPHGREISPAEVGVLASLGRSTAPVIRRPRIAILATGNELVDIGQPLTPGKIYNSNNYSVAALVRYYGADPQLLSIARDDEASVIASLREGLTADMLITSGGVSLGDYDVVKEVLARQGEIAFWTVRMKPGKPLAFGMLRGHDAAGNERPVPHLGLPGNPVSSMITFELFGRPAILKMMGKKNLALPQLEAVLADPVINPDGRRIFARAVLERQGNGYRAHLTGPQGSGILTSMAMANALVVIPEDRAEMTAGETVTALPLNWHFSEGQVYFAD